MKTRTATLILGLLASGLATADDKAPPLPWLVSGGHHYIVGVVWNEEAVQLLPAGLKATAERTGAINIYQAAGGYGISPYQSGYAWIDVEGHDSADGTKGRYIMKAGVGPERTQVAMKNLFQGDVAPGGTQLQDGDTWRGTGMRNGQPWVEIEIKGSNECQQAAGTLNYPISNSKMVQIPYAAEVCKAEPVSAKVMLPAGEKGGKLQPAKLIWAVELKDSRFALTSPTAMK